MTTYQDLIHETRHLLMTGQPDRLNVLASGIDNSPATTSVQFLNDLKGVVEGTTLCIGLEEMLVTNNPAQTAGSSATVIRAVNGSSIASHSTNDVIQVNPQFSDYRISKYVNQSLSDLSAQGLFQMQSATFTYQSSQSGYNLNAPNLIDIWRVRYDYPGSEKDWPIIRPDFWRIDQHPDPTDFPNGIQLVLYVGGYPGHTVRVSYRAGFTSLTNLSDNVQTISGLHLEAHDIPPLGAAIDLLAGREIKRTFLNRQPEIRRQEEVPVGGASQAMRPILQLYSDRISREVKRLRRRYPGTS